MARRLSELYAARDLARAQLDRERARGARDAQSTAQWTSLLGTGINAAAQGIGAVQGYRDTATARDVESALARNASELGELAPDTLESAAPKTYELPSMLSSKPFRMTDPLPQADASEGFVQPMRPPADAPRAVVPGQSADPYAPSRYAETPQQTAARLAREDPALADRTGLDAIFGSDRAEARRQAEALLAKDITGRRGQLDALKRAQAKEADERAFKLRDIQLKEGSRADEWRRFLLSAEAKQREGETDRAFQERLLGQRQAFERGENVLDRTSREKAAALGAGATAAQQARVPTNVSDPIAALASNRNLALGAVSDLEALAKDGEWLGASGAKANTIAQALGVDDARYTKWRADNQALIASYTQALSGAGVSEAEAARIMATMPNESDSPKTYRAKMDAFIKRVETKINDRLNSLEDTGYDVNKLRERSAAKPVSPQAAAGARFRSGGN